MVIYQYALSFLRGNTPGKVSDYSKRERERVYEFGVDMRCVSFLNIGLSHYIIYPYLGAKFANDVQWPFQEPKLEVTTISKGCVRPMSRNIPTKYGLLIV